MTIHQEGTKPIIAGILFIVMILVLFKLIFSVFTWWHVLFYTGILLLFSWLIWFFRSPRREIIQDASVILSPADGKVLEIKDVNIPAVSDQPMKQVSIFMSPLNVHLNRYPVGGEIISCEHFPGKYLVAWHPKSSPLNERTLVVIRSSDKRLIGVAQVAGFVARRIVCYAKTGQEVEQGAELGFIKFGSRADIFLPPDYTISVTSGDKVKGGLSVIARL